MSVNNIVNCSLHNINLIAFIACFHNSIAIRNAATMSRINLPLFFRYRQLGKERRPFFSQRLTLDECRLVHLGNMQHYRAERSTMTVMSPDSKPTGLSVLLLFIARYTSTAVQLHL